MQAGGGEIAILYRSSGHFGTSSMAKMLLAISLVVAGGFSQTQARWKDIFLSYLTVWFL